MVFRNGPNIYGEDILKSLARVLSLRASALGTVRRTQFYFNYLQLTFTVKQDLRVELSIGESSKRNDKSWRNMLNSCKSFCYMLQLNYHLNILIVSGGIGRTNAPHLVESWRWKFPLRSKIRWTKVQKWNVLSLVSRYNQYYIAIIKLITTNAIFVWCSRNRKCYVCNKNTVHKTFSRF